MTTDNLKEISILSALATDAVNAIHLTLLDQFTAAPDTSYKRAMFRQNAEYGNSLVIDVIIEDGDKKCAIKLRFGKV